MQTRREGRDLDGRQVLQVEAHLSTSSPQRHVGGSVLVHAAESQHSHGRHIGPGSPTYWSWQTWRDGFRVDGTHALQVEAHSNASSTQVQIGGMDLVHRGRSQHFHGLGAAMAACWSATASPQLTW